MRVSAGRQDILAHRYGITVTGIELDTKRVAGAARLTELVGLADKVRVLEAMCARCPCLMQARDAVISQEAFLHVPELPRALAEGLSHPETRRLLRLYQTGQRPRLECRRRSADVGRHGRAEALQCRGAGGASAGCRISPVIGSEDLSASWGEILKQRLAMYQKLRGETEKAGTSTGHDAFYLSYVRFVELVLDGGLGGARLYCAKAVSTTMSRRDRPCSPRKRHMFDLPRAVGYFHAAEPVFFRLPCRRPRAWQWAEKGNPGC